MRSATPCSRLAQVVGGFLVCLAPSVAAATWGENWGEMVWGAAAVPVLGPWSVAFLAGLVVGVAAVATRARRVKGALILSLLLALPLAALAVTLPFTFQNGTVADADEVNANFEALAYRAIPRSTGLGPMDGADSGAISSRTLGLTKDLADTALRIGYTDNFRVSGTSTSCRWEIRVDGASCPGGALVYDYYSGGGSLRHQSHSVVGYCEGLAAGAHTIQVFVGSTPGYSGADCYTGWSNSRWVIESEEVF